MSENAETLEARLVRFYITLPEPVSLPDGYTYHGIPSGYAVDSSFGLNSFVHLAFLQSQAVTRRNGSMIASADISQRLGESGGDALGSADYHEPNGQYTTAVATTVYNVNEALGGSWNSPQDAPLEKDAFNRCMAVISDVVRVYRVAFQVPCVMPAYEQMNPVIPYQIAHQAVMTIDSAGAFHFEESEWGKVNAFLLDHQNSPDFPYEPPRVDDLHERMAFYGSLLHDASPLFNWMERFLEAKRALEIDGQYGAAVTLGSTSSEVLLDSILALLFWESREDSKDVAKVFAEGRLVRRVKSRFSGLLGGSWSMDQRGPVADWFRETYKLRHRVVHGGYRPTRLEAEGSLRAVHGLSTFCWERIAQKRNAFPRVAMMTLGRQGLEKRGKWCAEMQAFDRDVAPVEPRWVESFGAWRAEMYKQLLEEDG